MPGYGVEELVAARHETAERVATRGVESLSGDVDDQGLGGETPFCDGEDAQLRTGSARDRGGATEGFAPVVGVGERDADPLKRPLGSEVLAGCDGNGARGAVQEARRGRPDDHAPAAPAWLGPMTSMPVRPCRPASCSAAPTEAAAATRVSTSWPRLRSRSPTARRT
jgi:hypothetical protein